MSHYMIMIKTIAFSHDYASGCDLDHLKDFGFSKGDDRNESQDDDDKNDDDKGDDDLDKPSG